MSFMDKRGCVFLYFTYLLVFFLGFLGGFLIVDAFCPRSEPEPAGPFVIEFVIGALLLVISIFLNRTINRKTKTNV